MLYLMTHGEYSDFTIDGLFEGPSGLELPDLVDEYAALKKLKPCAFAGIGLVEYIGADRQDFVKWLEARCGLKPVEYEDFQTGDDSTLYASRD